MAKKTKSEGASNQPVRGVDLGEVERLLEFMQKHRLEQFEYERDGVRVLLKKAPVQTASPARAARAAGAESSEAAPSSGPEVSPATAVAAAEAPAKAEAAKAAEPDVHIVKSPIVGTFYGAPSPGAEPFVTVGARVEQGQVLCIIEAMKLMNEIEADMGGEIVEIFVENGHPVEYGEKLFGIRTGRKK
ncbi:MAG TPA: acetyl-CoA carboxylase biotin carboxyl carrier protein [Candidatus Acidoferrales bacterium]|jgi:acetyl-CoA carboxylase biotin carboxyl carrier protein|nr:acetyl-CoA carboxylase biotin carboxyl carrier protein [Candidatus Acidoferrales bacterium]